MSQIRTADANGIGIPQSLEMGAGEKIAASCTARTPATAPFFQNHLPLPADGEVAERLNAPVLKTGKVATPSRVRTEAAPRRPTNAQLTSVSERPP